MPITKTEQKERNEYISSVTFTGDSVSIRLLSEDGANYDEITLSLPPTLKDSIASALLQKMGITDTTANRAAIWEAPTYTETP